MPMPLSMPSNYKVVFKPVIVTIMFATVLCFGQGYGLLYEILTRLGPERSRENERIAQAIFRGLRLHQAIRRKQGGARNDPHEIRAGVWRQRGHFGRVITNDYNPAVRSPTAPGLVCITARTIGFSPTHRDFYLRLAGHCKQVPKHKAKMARYGPWQTLWKTLTNGHHVTPPATCAYLKVPGLAGTPLRPGYSAREQWVLSKACRWLAMWCQHRPRKTGRRWAG